MSESIIKVSLHLNLRPLGEESETELIIPVGGPMPCIAIGLLYGEEPNEAGEETMDLKVDATGWRDPAAIAEFLHKLARHLEATESTAVSEEGVRLIPAAKPMEPGEVIR